MTKASLLPCALALLAGALAQGGCSDSCVTKTGNPGDSCGDPAFDGFGGDGGLPGLDDLVDPSDNPVLVAAALACGLDVDCEGGGIAEGNASISGVPSIDAFFGAVVQLQSRADHVSAGIDAELRAIAAAFGIAPDADLAAELQALIGESVEGRLVVDAAPARCHADVGAALAGKARCEGEVDPGSLEVECSGRCELAPSAAVSCSAGAELECAFVAAAIECDGQCAGRCEVELGVAARCDGVCRGSCEGECSAYADAAATECTGRCEGVCQGRCESELAAGADCAGRCTGECTTTDPSGGCEGAIRASCNAGVDAMVMCAGRCAGEVRAPMASVECEAAVRAEAKMNVECAPPRVAIRYRLRSELDAAAAARFEAGMRRLEVSLPALLASVARAESIVDAGEGLVAEASGALEAGISSADQAAAEGDLRVLFGLSCAVAEAAEIPDALGDSANRIARSVGDAAALTGALGM